MEEPWHVGLKEVQMTKDFLTQNGTWHPRGSGYYSKMVPCQIIMQHHTCVWKASLCSYLWRPYLSFAYSAAIATLLNKQNPLAAFLWLWWPGGLKQSFISLSITKGILVRSEDFLTFSYLTNAIPLHTFPDITESTSCKAAPTASLAQW